MTEIKSILKKPCDRCEHLKSQLDALIEKLRYTEKVIEDAEERLKKDYEEKHRHILNNCLNAERQNYELKRELIDMYNENSSLTEKSTVMASKLNKLKVEPVKASELTYLDTSLYD